jgi:hypothetical protein
LTARFAAGWAFEPVYAFFLVADPLGNSLESSAQMGDLGG